MASILAFSSAAAWLSFQTAKLAGNSMAVPAASRAYFHPVHAAALHAPVAATSCA